MEYKAAVVTQKDKVDVQSFPMPELDARDMMVKILMAGVCGTDVHLLYSDEPYPGQKQTYPFRLGHEWVGAVEEMGASFPKEDTWGNALQKGDRIVAYPSTWACGKCYFCKTLLQPHLCSRPPFGRDLPPMDSAFAQYLYLPADSAVYKVPDSVSTRAAVLVEPLAVALRAFERCFMPGVPDRAQGFGPGKSVAIFGSGAIGALLVALAKLSGAYPVIVVGGPQNRLELCKKLGADITIDIADTPREDRLRTVRQNTLRNLGVDVAFEAAGVPSAFVDALHAIRNGGTVVEVGHYTDHGEVKVNPREICQKDAQILGCWGYGPSAFGSALRILEANRDRVDFESLVTHQFPLEQVQDAVDTAKRQECAKAVLAIG